MRIKVIMEDLIRIKNHQVISKINLIICELCYNRIRKVENKNEI